jgi:uncharacterized protein (DUF2141 family)
MWESHRFNVFLGKPRSMLIFSERGHLGDYVDGYSRLSSGFDPVRPPRRSAALMLDLFIMLAAIASSSELGTAEGRCRFPETGPAILVDVAGLKDRSGTLVVEIYPDNDADFLKDDNLLVEEGKTFRRAARPVPGNGRAQLCVRVPRPGRYALSVVHDRDGKRAFNLSSDGIGFGGNPRLGWSKPPADHASILVGSAPVEATVVMNYRKGLLGFGPLRSGM